MRDSDNTAMTYSVSTGISSLTTDYYDINGVSLQSYTISKDSKDSPLVYGDSTYTSSDTQYSKYPIKLGKSKTKGTLTLTFDSNIIGCVVYAVAFNTDPVIMTCNGQEATLATSIGDYTEANAIVQSFKPYRFNFNTATTTIELSAKNSTKSVNGKTVSACRFFVADIALRLSGDIDIDTPETEEFILTGENFTHAEGGSGSGYAPFNGSRVIEGYTITTTDVMTNGSNLQFKKSTGNMVITREDNKSFTIELINTSGTGTLTLSDNIISNSSSNAAYAQIKLTLQ